MMYQSTLSGQFVELHPRLAAMLGYASAEEARRSITDIRTQLYTRPEQRDRLLAALAANDSVHHLEAEIVRKDGTRLWVAEYARALRAEDGSLRGLEGTLVDISPLRRAQQGAADAYRTFFEHSTIGMYRSTPDGRFIEVNAALAKLLGYHDPAELLSGIDHVADIYLEASLRDELLDQLSNQPHGATLEFALRRTDGSVIWVLERGRAVRGPDGQVLYFEGTILDVTERRDTELALRASEQRYRALVDNSRVGVFIANEGRYTYVNAAFAEMLGRTQEELAGLHFREVIAPEALRRAAELYEAQRASEPAPYSFETLLLHADGEQRVPVIATISVLEKGREFVTTGTLVDIREQKQIERRLRHNATHDPLTDLPNRALFLERLEQALQRGHATGVHDYAVCFLDLDGFKIVNDSLGHTAGDELLRAIAARIRKCIEPWDLVSRHGGDEFTLLLDQIPSIEAAVAVASRIHDALATPFLVNGTEIFTKASIGIAFGNEDYRSPDDLLRDADTAMYQAKARQTSRIAVFDRRMHETARRRLQLETDLRLALDRGEFTLHYQPVCELGSRRVRGFEALVRWQHPRMGLLLPRDFLAVAEETGLIVPLGEWVLQEALRRLEAWQQHDPGLFMSVNIAHRQFRYPQLADQVERALAQSGISAGTLHLELTESIFMENPRTATMRLEKLRAMGISLSLDDFGTGYSSFAHLNRYPIDTLKTDRSFVVEAGKSRRGHKVLTAIVELGQAIGLQLIAEGVENAGQVKRLRRLGVRYGQGNHLGRPLPPADVESLLESRRGAGWLERLLRPGR